MRYQKTQLPVKDCTVCGRPFSWRKKWAAVWHEVKYCSNACRHQRHAHVHQQARELR